MKRGIYTGAVAGLLIVASIGAALAESRDDRQGRFGGGERVSFESLDHNGDGEITVEDLTAARDARFADFDANGDGSVSLEEFQAHAAAQASERAAAAFERLDADGDGALSRDVLESQNRRGFNPERLIERLDADDSGSVTQEEFDEARSSFRERAREGRFGNRGGDRN